MKEQTFENLKVEERLSKKDYNSISDLSDFPNSIDVIKNIDFSSTSITQLGKDLKEYYELLIMYLTGDPRFQNKVDDFKALSTKISKYTLSSNDYRSLRDALLELQNYLNRITRIDIYGDEGIYYKLIEATNEFSAKVNTVIDDINREYSQLAEGGVGRVIPDNTINMNYLDNHLKQNFEFIDKTFGIYVDRTDGAVTLPNGLSKKPVIIKVKTNVSI